MSYILNIESSSTNCSVSLAMNGKLVYIRENNSENFSHSTKLHHFIVEVLKKSNLSTEALSAIAVSKGPGSYTGLRIGVSAAKGLCYALDIPLISVSTLLTLAKKVKIKKGLIIPVIDARRDEVYSAVFDTSYKFVEDAKPQIITKNSFQELSKNNRLYFIGTGQEKCKRLIKKTSNLNFSSLDNLPSSREMSQISFEKFSNSNFEDIAYFEPDYLKNFLSN